jgi:hypothetical protein
MNLLTLAILLMNEFGAKTNLHYRVTSSVKLGGIQLIFLAPSSGDILLDVY